MDLIIGITGSRNGDVSKVPEKLCSIQLANPEASFELHHDNCVGVDEEARKFASSQGWKEMIHLPDKSALRAFCESDSILEEKPYLKGEKNREVSGNNVFKGKVHEVFISRELVEKSDKKAHAYKGDQLVKISTIFSSELM